MKIYSAVNSHYWCPYSLILNNFIRKRMIVKSSDLPKLSQYTSLNRRWPSLHGRWSTCVEHFSTACRFCYFTSCFPQSPEDFPYLFKYCYILPTFMCSIRAVTLVISDTFFTYLLSYFSNFCGGGYSDDWGPFTIVHSLEKQLW